MPSNEYGPGSHSWTAPFATNNVTATCIGGGGSGHKDKSDNEQGGGGGGGGYGKSTRSIAGGTVINFTVGSGGEQPGNQSSNDGGDTRIQSGALSAVGNGGQGGRDGQGGAGGTGGGDITGNGENGQEDADDVNAPEGSGRGGGAGKPGGNAGGCGGRQFGGQGVNLDGTNGSCTGGRAGGAYGGGGAGNDNGGEAGRGGNGRAKIEWDYHAPQINSFNAITFPTSDGTPNNEAQLSWTTTYASSVSINQGIGSQTSPYRFSTGLQSVAGSNSPATKTYTLTATGPGGTTTASVTVSIQNDNTPSNAWTTSFSNLEPSAPNTTKQIGTLSGIDMTIRVSSSSSGVFFGSSQSGSFANPQYFTNGQSVYIRMTTLPFNTDVSGETGIYGKTNTKTVSVTAGTVSFNVSYITRAPVIRETFDYDGNIGAYPYPDIDLIANTPTQYINSQTINMDDIEIAMPIKSNNGNLQVKINNGGWSNMSQI